MDGSALQKQKQRGRAKIKYIATVIAPGDNYFVEFFYSRLEDYENDGVPRKKSGYFPYKHFGSGCVESKKSDEVGLKTLTEDK